MTVLWLIIWVLFRAPSVTMWNGWAVGLAVCFAIDFLGVSSK
jgi:hypothetical protein